METLRHPSSTTDVNAVSVEGHVSETMKGQFFSLQGSVNILLNDPNYKTFNAFSNHAFQTSDTFASLEDIHNSLHDFVGNGGHMSFLETAAFDPVFWIHHGCVTCFKI